MSRILALLIIIGLAVIVSVFVFHERSVQTLKSEVQNEVQSKGKIEIQHSRTEVKIRKESRAPENRAVQRSLEGISSSKLEEMYRDSFLEKPLNDFKPSTSSEIPRLEEGGTNVHVW